MVNNIHVAPCLALVIKTRRELYIDFHNIDCCKMVVTMCISNNIT